METTTQSYFWPVFWACIAGVVLLVGLVLELLAEKKWFKSVKSLRRCASAKRCGEIAVIIGVLGEVVVAGVTAIHERQIWQMAINNDPRNQPVSDLSADAVFFAYGSNMIPDERDVAGVFGVIAIGATNSPVSIEGWNILASRRQNVHNVGINFQQCDMHFETEGVMRTGGLPALFGNKSAGEIVTNFLFLKISFLYLPTNTTNVSGMVTIHVNGINKTFHFPPSQILNGHLPAQVTATSW